MLFARRLDQKILVLAAVLAACAPVIATSIEPTEASPSLAPLGQPTTSPSATHSIATSDNNAINIAVLRLEQPGHGSEIVAPLHVSAQVPAAAGVVRVELFGEDGRLMARQVVRTVSGLVELELAFEPAGLVENARLALSLDDEFGRRQELISVEITLLAAGESNLVDGGQQNRIVIQTPHEGETVSGGLVTVSGVVRQPAGQLNIQLITRERRVMISADFRPDEGQGTFSAELAYNMSAAAWVQVAVSLREAGIVTEFKSVEVWLTP